MNIQQQHSPYLALIIRLMWRRPIRRLRNGLIFIGAGSTAVLSPLASAVELPVPCSTGSCGVSGPSTWVTSGAATAVTSGNTMTVNQSSENAVLNWSSFNISADGKVIFAQPSTSSIALNRIFQQSPSQILGRIDANGQIYLVNPNGLIFGSNSTVNAAGILASTLNISDDVFNGGLLSAVQSRLPALSSDGRTTVIDYDGKEVVDANGNAIPVELLVQAGAKMSTTEANGRILLAGQNVSNAGTLTANDGQVILAAGEKVYLTSSQDAKLRGLYVEVDGGGTATNAVAGTLQAARGNITMVGLAVNQQGRVSASTTVAENGSVRLLAQDTASIAIDESGVSTLSASRGGVVTLGSNSSIDISPDLQDTRTAVDEQEQMLSSVEVVGQQITMQSGSSITAAGGNLSMTAATNPSDVTATDMNAHLRIEKGAVINLSGSDAIRSVADNIVSVELRASELADDPYQRNGALRGQTVSIDARVGTDIANVSGAIAGISKTVAQRTSKGGTATFESTGDIVVADGATIDVSGGQTTYTGANVATSQLITADGKLVDISAADAETTYVGVLGPTITVKHDRWGVVEKVVQQNATHYEAGYIEGSSAGTVQFSSPTMLLSGTLLGKAVNGTNQRDASADNYAQGGQLIIGVASALTGGTIERLRSLSPPPNPT
ncbi:MAG: filamentous hemagglutinin N-terminal domain-containing protein [Steroidobacteraceae bacterium]